MQKRPSNIWQKNIGLRNKKPVRSRNSRQEHGRKIQAANTKEPDRLTTVRGKHMEPTFKDTDQGQVKPDRGIEARRGQEV